MFYTSVSFTAYLLVEQCSTKSVCNASMCSQTQTTMSLYLQCWGHIHFSILQQYVHAVCRLHKNCILVLEINSGKQLLGIDNHLAADSFAQSSKRSFFLSRFYKKYQYWCCLGVKGKHVIKQYLPALPYPFSTRVQMHLYLSQKS